MFKKSISLGLLSLGLMGCVDELEVVCKHGSNDYRKHFLGLSDNVTYIAEQLDGLDVSVYHTRITFKPQSIIPDVDFRGDAVDLITPRDSSD